MPDLSPGRQLRISARTANCLLMGRPITVSFEITYNCNARCKHCDLGDYVKEPRLGPEVFGQWIADLRPAVAQVSGGEPLLRKDVYDIIAEMRRRDPVAVFVITTNSSLLNEEKYLKLRASGMDQFSLSLDYPDERHNEFRQLKGNFEHIRDLVARIVKHNHRDIVLACVVQSDNFRDLPRMAELAKEWGVTVNFSTYNSLRTGDEDLLVRRPDDLEELRQIVERLVVMQGQGYPVMTSPWTMRQMIKFFAEGRQANCGAGKKFAIVNPWGKLTPCGMNREHYDSQKELVRKFSKHNKCESCFTAIRANSEKSPYRLLADALRVVRQG